MKKVLLALAGLLVSGPVQAQDIPSTLDQFYRTFHGCDSRGSCVWVTFRHTQTPSPNPQYWVGPVTWRARFTAPARTYAFRIDAWQSDYFGGSATGEYVLFESGIDDPVAFQDLWPPPWRPQWATAIFQYEDEYEFGEPDRFVALTPTPEPASLLLLVSGLVGIAAAARSRRGVADASEIT